MWRMQPCPMHREIENTTYCVLDNEFEMILLISFYDPEELFAADLDEFVNPTFCLNAVETDDEGFIFCPTKRRRIEIREKPIPQKVYENTRETLLFMDPDAISCSDCLYKAFVTLIKSLEEM